jgi:uncharacterized protein YjdB
VLFILKIKSMKKNAVLSVIIAIFTGISQTLGAQSSCETALDATLGVNQAQALPELWYKFSVGGQPLAQYYANYDVKSLHVNCEFFAGACGDLIGQGNGIPAVEGDTRTYYIRFTWENGAAPQAFEWTLYQRLIVPMTDIEVTPPSYNLAFGGSFRLNNVFTVKPVPENTTESFLTEYRLIDGEGLIDPPVFQASNTTLTAIGSGTAKLAFFATSWDDYSSLGADTVTINVSAPALCASATTVSAGANTAQAVQEQWFRFTAEKSGIYTVKHEAETPSGDKISVGWTAYRGDCNTLRRQEAVYIENAQCGFRAEAGETCLVKLYQYGSTAFDFTLESPVSVSGFSLATRELELDLYAGYSLADLGLNFTPADATDKGVSVEVRDPNIIKLSEDGQATVYKDAIQAVGEGSTYLVFTTADGGFKDSCRVTVKYIHLTSFRLSLHEKTLWLPYSESGEYLSVSDTTLSLLFEPANATDKGYTVAVRNKGVVEADRYGIRALREGDAHVVFTANDGHLQDSILIHVTRAAAGGLPCEGAAVAQLGENNMPAAENHTEWFRFTPPETANYALTINVEKYPFTYAEVYRGDCSSLYLVNDGVLSSAGYSDSYGAGFFGEAGQACYLKLTTGDYNTQGGGTIVSYTWKIARISASISGAVTDNGSAAQGSVELYSVKRGSVVLLQTVAIQGGGSYRFDNLGVEDYAVRAVTTAGDVTWYGSNTPYFVESAVVRPAEPGAITGRDIDIVRRETLSGGTAKISGYIVKSEDVAPQNSPSIRRVKSAEGNPAAGVTVFLLRSGESTPVSYRLTDAEGYFEFTGVGTGEYGVRVQVAGLESETTEVSITEDGETVEIAYEVSETGIEESGGTAVAAVASTDVRIYPNPVGERFRIGFVAAPAQVVVMDVSGKTVLRQTVRGDESVFVGHLPQGIYVVRVNEKTFKIIRN